MCDFSAQALICMQEHSRTLPLKGILEKASLELPPYLLQSERDGVNARKT